MTPKQIKEILEEYAFIIGQISWIFVKLRLKKKNSVPLGQTKIGSIIFFFNNLLSCHPLLDKEQGKVLSLPVLTKISQTATNSYHQNYCLHILEDKKAEWRGLGDKKGAMSHPQLSLYRVINPFNMKVNL